MRLHHFEDKEIIFLHQAVIRQSAFQAGETFLDQRRFHLVGFDFGQLEPGELVDFGALAVPYSDHCIYHLRSGDIDHAFAAVPDQLETMVAAGDDAAHQ